MGVSGGAFRTTLVMGETKLGLEQLAFGATLERRFERLTLQLGAGGIALGNATPEGEAAIPFRGGGFGNVAVSYTLLEQDGAVPFVMLGGSLSGSGASTAVGAYGALDLRVSVVAGYTVFERVTPYLVGRLFGGPAFFRGASGGDLYHYQLGAGLAAGTPFGIDLFAEVVPLGETRITAGVGYSF